MNFCLITKYYKTISLVIVYYCEIIQLIKLLDYL